MRNENRLLELAALNICPTCGKDIPDGKQIGTGMHKDGVFCSLDCYLSYHGDDLVVRAKRIQELANKKQDK